MAVTVEGDLPTGATAKDVILAIIRRIGTGGGIGSIIEYRGSTHPVALHGGPHDRVQHVDRGGRQGGLSRPDDVTLAYLAGRRHAPTGADWERAVEDWLGRPTTGRLRQAVDLGAADIVPRLVGHQPGQVAPITEAVPARPSPTRPT